MYNATSLDEVSDLVRFVIRNHLRPTGMINLTCLVWFVADLHARICLALLVATGHQLHESARFVQQCYKSAELLQQQAVRIRSTSRTQRICHRGIDVSVVTYLSLRLMAHHVLYSPRAFLIFLFTANHVRSIRMTAPFSGSGCRLRTVAQLLCDRARSVHLRTIHSSDNRRARSRALT